jgi:hypothetical protein
MKYSTNGRGAIGYQGEKNGQSVLPGYRLLQNQNWNVGVGSFQIAPATNRTIWYANLRFAAILFASSSHSIRDSTRCFPQKDLKPTKGTERLSLCRVRAAFKQWGQEVLEQHAWQDQTKGHG